MLLFGGAENAEVENAGVENAGATKSEKILSSTRRNMTVVAFMPTCCQTQLISELFAFLGHLQHITIDSVSDVSRVTRGLAIRRAKKRVKLTNDQRIKMCLQTFDRCAYTRLQFLRAVSHAVDSEKMLSESHSDADDDDDTENPDDNTQHQNDDDASDDAGTPTTASADAAVDFCEVCLVAPRDTRIALVSCGHQRFCESYANEVHNQGPGCPLCRTPMNMLLRLY